MKYLCGLIVLLAVLADAIDSSRFKPNIKALHRLQEVVLENVTVTNNLPNPKKIIRERASIEMGDGAWYVCDLSNLIQRYRNWTYYLPRVIPFYAVKSNDNPHFVRTLAALGTGFDCASKNEIEEVLNIGVHPSRIIYANPSKYASHLSFAQANNVKKMTFDGDVELYKIKKLFPDANLLLRFRADATQASVLLGRKFGCDAEIDCLALIQLASDLGLNVVGVAFHVGTGLKEYVVFERAIRTARKLFDEAASIGVKLKILDIGGGFSGDTNSSLDEVSEVINKALDTYFPSKDVTFISEPGRYFSASTATLACRIQSIRRIVRNGKIERIMYFLNDGQYGSFGIIPVIDNRIMRPTLLKTYEGPLYNSSLWGPTCDSRDQIADNLVLPEMHLDDILMYEDLGAYAVEYKTNFNGMPTRTYKCYIAATDIADLNPSNIKKKFCF